MAFRFILSRYHNLNPDNLPQLGFLPHARFSHFQITSVVLSFLRRNGPWRNLYFLSSAAVALGYLYWIITNDNDYARMSAGTWFLIGMVGFVILIPLHEGLHLLAYHLAGARKLFVKAEWKRGYFLAGAPNFVADARSIFFVAFLPFVLITALHLGIILTIRAEWVTMLWGSLFMHTLGCVGDFAMVDFFRNLQNGEMVTYDTEDGFTVFMVRPRGGAPIVCVNGYLK